MEKGRIVRRRSALSKIPLKRRLFGVRGVASDVRSVGGVVGSVRGVVGSVGGVFDNVLNNSVRSVRGLVGRLLTASGERSEEHTYELQSLMRISYAVFCLKKNKQNKQHKTI